MSGQVTNWGFKEHVELQMLESWNLEPWTKLLGELRGPGIAGGRGMVNVSA